MIKENKVRVTVTIPKELDNDIATLCEQMGVSRSQFVCMALGEKVMGYKKAFEIASQTLQVHSNNIIRPIS